MHEAYRGRWRMSAVLTISQAQACMSAALADDVAAIGGVAIAAQECGVSEDTVRRWLSGSNGDWTRSAIAALIVAAHHRLGRSLVQDRMAALTGGTAQVGGDKRRALSDALETLPALLATAQKMAAASADGRISSAEAREILSALPGVINQLDRLQADLVSLIREG
jgi:hypothetical protein